MDELYKKVTELFSKNPPLGHDIKHALRVSSLAKQIANEERYDIREAEVAGLLHDVGRTITAKGHAQKSVPIAKKFLDEYTNFSNDAKERILSAIEQHSNKESEGDLAHILQDADKLDGIGAIGIARGYICFYNYLDYNPDDILPEPGPYGQAKTIHEHLALLLSWYGMLYTTTAKRIGKPRHEFLKQFMEEIKREIEESTDRNE